MTWFETGFNPNFRPTRVLFQDLVRQSGSYGSDYNTYSDYDYIYMQIFSSSFDQDGTGEAMLASQLVLKAQSTTKDRRKCNNRTYYNEKQKQKQKTQKNNNNNRQEQRDLTILSPGKQGKNK